MKIDDKEYQIDKEGSKIRTWDSIYCNLLEKILREGEIFENRTGIDTLSIAGVNFSLDLGKEFPVLESKKVYLKNAISEIQWIYQVQSNDVRWLQERGNNIWNEWMIDADGIYRIYDPNVVDLNKKVLLKDKEGNIVYKENGEPVYVSSLIEGKTIKDAIYFGIDKSYTIGDAYGYINSLYKRPQYVEHQLKNNPHDRRMNIVLWQDAHIKDAVLPSCVWSSEWKVNGNKLNSYIHQRSADVPLGLPFNVSQYAVLHAMFAKAANLELGTMNYSIMDAHIYENQIDGIMTQINRYSKMLVLENYIMRKDEKYLELYYKSLQEKEQLIIDAIANNPSNETYKKDYEDIKEKLMLLKLMITKKKPELVLADKSSIFDFSTDYNLDKEYLKENPTGNEDIKVLNYKSAPFIKMPVAQ